MAVRGGDHDRDRGRVEQRHDAQLEQAQVVPRELDRADAHRHCGDVHTAVWLISNRACQSALSARGAMSVAVVKTADHTRVARAMCMPLASAASVNADSAPTATCASRAAMLTAAKMRAQGAQSLITSHRKYTSSAPTASASPRCSIVKAFTPPKSGVNPAPHRGHALQDSSARVATTAEPLRRST